MIRIERKTFVQSRVNCFLVVEIYIEFCNLDRYQIFVWSNGGQGGFKRNTYMREYI